MKYLFILSMSVMLACSYQKEIESQAKWLTLVVVEQAPESEHPDRVKMIWKDQDGVARTVYSDKGTNLKCGYQMWALIDK